MADLYLKNAQVVTDTAEFRGGILVEGEKISEVIEGGPNLKASQVVDLDGKVLLPGFIDAHVHFNEPGRTHWEGYRTGTMAAEAGGATTVLEMPLNAIPPTINRAALELKRQAVTNEAVIDYGNSGGLVDNNLADLDELNAEGVIGYKAFASASGVEFEAFER